MAHHKDAFFDALAEDFNTPKALASLFEWVREANRRAEPAGDADLGEMLGVLGLGISLRWRPWAMWRGSTLRLRSCWRNASGPLRAGLRGRRPSA